MIVLLKHMKDYADEQFKALLALWNIFDAEVSIVVGGGVLFGYLGGLNKLAEKGFKLPDVENAQYFTSKSYAIASWMMHEQAKRSQKA